MVCLICERGVQGNDIGFGVQFFKRNIFREIFYAGIFAAAVSQSAAAEAGQLLYNSASDLPGSDDSYGQVFQLASDQPAQGIIIYLCAPQSLLVIAQAEKDHHNRVVGNSVRVILCVADMDTDFFRIGDVDMVISDGAGGEIDNPAFFHEVKFWFPVIIHAENADAASRRQFRNHIHGKSFAVKFQINAWQPGKLVKISCFIFSCFKCINFHSNLCYPPFWECDAMII